jgi:hypothetical protein
MERSDKTSQRETSMKQFTATEKKILLGFLDQLRGHMSNAGCNDFTIENTPENLQCLKTP